MSNIPNRHFTMEERLNNIAKRIAANDQAVMTTIGKINSLEMMIAQFETSDIIDENNPAFSELCKFFYQLDDSLIEIQRILTNNYRR